jgi:hemolysin III
MSAASEALVKPRLRGVSHQWAALVAVGLVVPLALTAPGGRATAAAVVYGVAVCLLFGISALYHRRDWRPAARAWMRRLDHSMIFVFIAATYTPVALLILHGSLATAILAVVWGGAAGGVLLNLLWTTAPKWVSAMVYVALGWVAVAAVPQLWDGLGWLGMLGLGAGGLLYTAGAVVYARGRPDPAPHVFGYHEVFHVLVIAAAALHYAVIAFAVVPHAGG